MIVLFTLKDILGRSVFLSGGLEECRNGVLNVVYFTILSSFELIESYHSYLRGILTTPKIWSSVGYFVVILISLLPITWMCHIWLNIDTFLEYLFWKCSCLYGILWRVSCCIFLGLLTWYSLHNLLNCCWLFSFNAKDS